MLYNMAELISWRVLSRGMITCKSGKLENPDPITAHISLSSPNATSP